MTDPKIFLLHIEGSIRNIERFSEGLTYEKFKADRLHQSAIIRELEIIGEAAKNLPSDFKRKHHDIEWSKISGLRDVLIHHYFGVNLERVWEILGKDLPELKRKLEKIGKV